MRPILLALILAATCHGQTLKWTYVLPDIPPLSEFVGGDQATSDAAGNTAFVSIYKIENDYTTPLVWLSASGKQLATDALPGSYVVTIYVSGSELLIFSEPPNGGTPFLRKYSRKRGIVTTKDTPIAARSYIAGRTGSSDHLRNFFITVESDEDRKPIALRRYNR
jgi:hypothetical protein